MAKCSICNSRKGKRKCKVNETFICSLCCGQTRNIAKCEGCSFFKNANKSRNYRKVPFYVTNQMSDSMELQDISNTIESILCGFELNCEELFNDKTAIGLLELFFDKYYFKDLELNFGTTAEKEQFNEMVAIVEQDLSSIPEEQRIKVMASIYRSIQRRTNGGREYLQFAQQYVGARIASGARALTT
jgi:hypothetical protein